MEEAVLRIIDYRIYQTSVKQLAVLYRNDIWQGKIYLREIEDRKTRR